MDELALTPIALFPYGGSACIVNRKIRKKAIIPSDQMKKSFSLSVLLTLILNCNDLPGRPGSASPVHHVPELEGAVAAHRDRLDPEP